MSKGHLLPVFYLIALFSLLVPIAAGCTGDKTNNDSRSVKDSLTVAQIDTDAVVMALMPTLDCLPYYYAQENGLFKREGGKVVIRTYRSQWDCDTAILGHSGALGVMDSLRMAYYKKRGAHLKKYADLTDSEWALVACGVLRLKDVRQLKLRTIATSRYSLSAACVENVLKTIGVKRKNALLPQVNDIVFRAEKLEEDQVVAAVLPEPYVPVARLSGHRILWYAKGGAKRSLVWNTRQIRSGKYAARLESMRRAYAAAADSLDTRGGAVCRDLLRRRYNLSETVIDSLKIPNFGKTTSR